MRAIKELPAAEVEAFTKELFPQGTPRCQGLSFEANGLGAGTVPQNCEIILRGQATRSKKRREFFLVRTDAAIAFLRVCAADAASGYAEFVAGLAWAKRGTGDEQSVEKYGRETIEVLCA